MHAFQWVTKEHPQLLIFHVANERKTSVGHHMKLKRLGVLKGAADFLAYPAFAPPVAIELKDDKGEQDADQERFQRRFEAAGGRYFLVRTLEQFQGVIDAVTLFAG